ncbi:hypothetical protein HPP92_022467 [Vanilla planifolia]|uniref:Uncharacterized protein n=1 Tax=Vanilla planifolia TaxID=51239 RepID=A0A835UDU7_VANPL|nr:hypothetical protein HPP92_022467 [Vanilla planifolia]
MGFVGVVKEIVVLHDVNEEERMVLLSRVVAFEGFALELVVHFLAFYEEGSEGPSFGGGSPLGNGSYCCGCKVGPTKEPMQGSLVLPSLW